ncbi:MAG: YeeE/YedE family protein [Candidatus Melainabacteria bacterium]|nr:YeeE/YedE family protein [Candidatus Melainabacteria bacterium]
MDTAMFASWKDVMGGLCVGIAFGFLLRKAHVTRFSVIVRQLLLKDFTVMRVMMSAIAFGSLGIYSLRIFFPEIPMSINSTTLPTALIGGGLFGIGMAVLGYCPGTGIGALANGAKDMWSGLFGMVVGAGLYAELYPWIAKTLKPEDQLTKVTLSEYFGLSPWIFVGGLILLICAMVLMQFFRFAGLRKPLISK